MQNYLITTSGHNPCTSDYFDAENNFNKDLDMVVFNLYELTYTRDGVEWHPIHEDHL